MITTPEDDSNYFLKLYIFALNSDFVHKMKCKLVIVSLLSCFSETTYSLLKFQSSTIPLSSAEGQGKSCRVPVTLQLQPARLLCPENFRQGWNDASLAFGAFGCFVCWVQMKRGFKAEWNISHLVIQNGVNPPKRKWYWDLIECGFFFFFLRLQGLLNVCLDKPGCEEELWFWGEWLNAQRERKQHYLMLDNVKLYRIVQDPIRHSPWGSGSRLYFCEANSREFLETGYRAGDRETTKDWAMIILEGHQDVLIKITARARFLGLRFHQLIVVWSWAFCLLPHQWVMAKDPSILLLKS